MKYSRFDTQPENSNFALARSQTAGCNFNQDFAFLPLWSRIHVVHVEEFVDVIPMSRYEDAFHDVR